MTRPAQPTEPTRRHEAKVAGILNSLKDEIREIRRLLETLVLENSRARGLADHSADASMVPWTRPLMLSEAAIIYGVPERTFRAWIKRPNSNGINHKRVGNLVMLDQRDVPACARSERVTVNKSVQIMPDAARSGRSENNMR